MQRGRPSGRLPDTLSTILAAVRPGTRIVAIRTGTHRTRQWFSVLPLRLSGGTMLEARGLREDERQRSVAAVGRELDLRGQPPWDQPTAWSAAGSRPEPLFFCGPRQRAGESGRSWRRPASFRTSPAGASTASESGT